MGFRSVSRIRQIKPSWFLDKTLRRGTNADTREFYIGLWMLADDAGYLVWDVERVAAELYPYDHDKRRERNVLRWGESLMALEPEDPHLVVWDCGHARVPKMPGHQRIAGNQTFAVKKIHAGDQGNPPPDRCRKARSRPSLQVATDPESLQVATGSHGNSEGNGRERNGEVGNGSAPAGATTEFQEKVSRLVALGGER
jgi:hypothetical protein